MHAVIHRLQPGDELQVLRTSAHERIEQPHFHVGVRIESQPDSIGLAAVHVVDQHAYPHAPVGRGDELPDQQPANGILMKHVVLHVDTALGQARRHGTPDKRIQSVAQQVNAGLRRMLLQLCPERLAQAGAGTIANRARKYSVFIVWQHGATFYRTSES